MSALEAKATYEETTTDDNNISNGAGGSDSNEMVIVTHDDDDELFELDIALLRDADDDQHRRRSHGVDDDGHALLANCLLPVSSVSKAVPVPASSILSSYAPLSGYNNSRRFFFAAGGSGRRLGRAGNGSSSARFCLSSRAIDAMRNFQRY